MSGTLPDDVTRDGAGQATVIIVDDEGEYWLAHPNRVPVCNSTFQGWLNC